MDIKKFIFNKYKDQPLIAKPFREKIEKTYNITPDEARDIFVRINNYQVKKYGGKLDNLKEILPYSKEELYKIGDKARQRKYERRS